jgi:hypothetical protein
MNFPRPRISYSTSAGLTFLLLEIAKKRGGVLVGWELSAWECGKSQVLKGAAI